jgi:hypothetical protein
LDLEIGVEGIQLLFRQVIDRASRRLLAIEELDSQVLGTVTRHRLCICFQKDLHIGPMRLRISRLRPGGHEDVFGRIAVWVETQLVEVQLIAVHTLCAHGSNKCAC